MPKVFFLEVNIIFTTLNSKQSSRWVQNETLSVSFKLFCYTNILEKRKRSESKAVSAFACKIQRYSRYLQKIGHKLQLDFRVHIANQQYYHELRCSVLLSCVLLRILAVVIYVCKICSSVSWYHIGICPL